MTASAQTDDLGPEELHVAHELAFALLRDAFHDLAVHLTYDGATLDALLVLEARVESSLELALLARGERPRDAVSAYAARMVRRVLRDAHERIESDLGDRMGSAVQG